MICDDGGSAFPYHGSMGEVVNEGMTLRDYFAAKAIPMILAKTFSGPGEIDIVACAGACYQIADAMLAARDSETQS